MVCEPCPWTWFKSNVGEFSKWTSAQFKRVFLAWFAFQKNWQVRPWLFIYCHLSMLAKSAIEIQLLWRNAFHSLCSVLVHWAQSDWRHFTDIVNAYLPQRDPRNRSHCSARRKHVLCGILSIHLKESFRFFQAQLSTLLSRIHSRSAPEIFDQHLVTHVHVVGSVRPIIDRCLLD